MSETNAATWRQKLAADFPSLQTYLGVIRAPSNQTVGPLLRPPWPLKPVGKVIFHLDIFLSVISTSKIYLFLPKLFDNYYKIVLLVIPTLACCYSSLNVVAPSHRKVLKIRSISTTLYFLCSLLMGPFS